MTPRERQDRIKALELELKALKAGGEFVEVFSVRLSESEGTFTAQVITRRGKAVHSYEDGTVLVLMGGGSHARAWPSISAALVDGLRESACDLATAQAGVDRAEKCLKAVQALAETQIPKSQKGILP